MPFDHNNTLKKLTEKVFKQKSIKGIIFTFGSLITPYKIRGIKLSILFLKHVVGIAYKTIDKNT